eukprot:3071686-Amphidinium_carterae.1
MAFSSMVRRLPPNTITVFKLFPFVSRHLVHCFSLLPREQFVTSGTIKLVRNCCGDPTGKPLHPASTSTAGAGA